MALGGTLGKRLISTLLIGHLGLLSIAAIPSPEDLAAAEGVRASNDDAISAQVRPALDVAGRAVQWLTKQAWVLTAFIRPLAHRYAIRLGLGQTWNMFGAPPRRGEYLRLRYFWTSGKGSEPPLMTATELVFPAAPDTNPHLFAAFWEGHRDKAISNAFGDYFLDRTRLNVTSPTLEELETGHVGSLKPVVEFFAAQYASNRLAPQDELIRVEVWYGWADSRPRGETLVSPQSRAAALQRYYDGAPARAAPRSPVSAIDTVEREGDFQWVLMFAKVP